MTSGPSLQGPGFHPAGAEGKEQSGCDSDFHSAMVSVRWNSLGNDIYLISLCQRFLPLKGPDLQ